MLYEKGQRHRVAFTLNGKPVSGEAEPRMLLVDFLRHEIGLTGTHVGCEHGVCGACTIQIDGEPARACLTYALRMEGRELRTVEALAGDDDALSPFAESLQAEPCAAMRVLYAGHSDDFGRMAQNQSNPK